MIAFIVSPEGAVIFGHIHGRDKSAARLRICTRRGVCYSLPTMSEVFLGILAPILILVLLGAILRWRFALDLGTLSKLNIYLFVPGFIFHRVSTSELEWSAMGGIVGVTLLLVLVLGMIVLGVGRMLGVESRTLAAVAMVVMFYNSGNYGLPLAELRYGADGGAIQSFVLATQNLLTFTVGLAIAAWAGSGQIGRGIVTVLRMPMLPALGMGLLLRWWSGGNTAALPAVLIVPAGYLAAALIPVALVTLGAQLASNPRWPRWKPVSAVLVLRLLIAPLLMAGILYSLSRTGWSAVGLWPWPAELLILTAAVPSAVNTLLLTLELDGDADLTADCIFWTTIASVVTITFWLLAIPLFAGG
jgi:malate permease and related proteins